MDQLTPDQEDGGCVEDPQNEYRKDGERPVDGPEMGEFEGNVEGEEMFGSLKKKSDSFNHRCYIPTSFRLNNGRNSGTSGI